MLKESLQKLFYDLDFKGRK